MALDMLLLYQCVRNSMRNALATNQPSGFSARTTCDDIVRAYHPRFDDGRRRTAVVTGANTTLGAQIASSLSTILARSSLAASVSGPCDRSCQA